MKIIDALAAHHIATPLKDAETVEINEAAGDARERLQAKNFDQAPVVKQSAVVGWVATNRLSDGSRVKGFYQPLERSRFAGASSSINDVLPHLAAPGFCFTVWRAGLEGFITPSDLDRHAARCHFYLLVAGVEMALSSVVRSLAPESELIEHISTHPMRPGENGGVETLRSTFEAARRAGRDTHPVEYLYLGELIEILAFRLDMDISLVKNLEMVRDLQTTVMHPTRALSRLGATQLAAAAGAAVVAHEQLRALSPAQGDITPDDHRAD
ncbi:MAG: hypothetical protein H0U35_08935 [Sporichthyaceae bacterium]|nr:hypothetical protein [Sporichthyaceae bacterium]